MTAEISLKEDPPYLLGDLLRRKTNFLFLYTLQAVVLMIGVMLSQFVPEVHAGQTLFSGLDCYG